MRKNSKDPFADLVLDDEERRIEAALAKGGFEELPDFKNTKKMLEKAARRHRELNATRPITLRVRQIDLVKIKAKAQRNNIPYQTLLGALLHDFAESKRGLSIK